MKRVFVLLSACILIALGLSSCAGDSEPNESHVHSFGEWVATDATCTEDGSRVRTCTSCSEVESEVIAAVGHNFGEWIVLEATCKEAGSRSRTCTACNTAELDIIPQKDHSFGEWTLTDATCTEDGSRVRTCTSCSEVESEVIAAVGHDLSPADCLNPEICKTCGAAFGEPLGHTYAEVWSSDASGHWHELICGCEIERGVDEHFDSDDADFLCDTCSYSLIETVSLVFSDSPYKIIYKTTDTTLKSAIVKLVNAVSSETGVQIAKLGGTSDDSPYEILIGYVSQREESVSAQELVNVYETSKISVYSIKFYESKLVVAVSDKYALERVMARLRDFVCAGDFAVPKNIDEFVIFDTVSFVNDGGIVEYSKDELDAISSAKSISINGAALSGFSPDAYEYEQYTNIMEGYPTVTASASMNGAMVVITQPTGENGGIATVKITGLNGTDTTTYTVSFKMQETFETATEVVNKDGKGGVVTIVIDDGNTKTGKKAEELLAKYPDMTVTFALITRKLAGFLLSDDGSEYVRGEDGSFVITQTDAQRSATEYWQSLLEKFPNVEFTSHSQTHAYAGEDDTTLYIAYDTNGKKYVFPIGSISAEIYGAVQVIKELFGHDSPGFIIPGISGAASGFTINSWWPYIKDGLHLGARGTSSSTDAASMVMMPSDFKNEKLRWRGRAFMIRYFNMATTTDESGKKSFLSDTVTPEEAIAAGISHATDFIDSAVQRGGWACFCLHDIIDVGSSGTHPIYTEQADALFSYVNSLSESGDAWVATYGDALTYYCEWASATPTAIAHTDKYIELSVSCEEKNELFDMPLTVKVAVPASWERVTYTYLNEEKELTVHTANDGSKFVYADVIPDFEFGIIAPAE